MNAIIEEKDFLTSKNKRLSKKLKLAIERIVKTNENRNTIAESIGFSRQALYLALRRPHVIEYMESISQAYLAESKQIARKTIIDLCQFAKSDDVRLRAARTILELEGKKDGDNSARMGDVTIIIHNNDAQLTTNQQTIEAISTEYKEL